MVVRFVYKEKKHFNLKLNRIEERERKDELSERKQKKKKNENKNFDLLHFKVQIIDK